MGRKRWLLSEEQRKQLRRTLGGPDPSEPKLSECLLDVARPFLPPTASLAHTGRIMDVAAVAWRAALLPRRPTDRWALDRLGAHAEGPADRVSILEMFHALVLRKKELYPKDRRAILGCEVHEDECGVRVDVRWEDR